MENVAEKVHPTRSNARYTRQVALPEIGSQGQERLRAARVLVVGVGGLGSPASLYLAAAGVGTIVLADHDRVDLSNLQRQIAHATPDLGRPKVESAAEKLRVLNPETTVETWPRRFERANAAEMLEGCDFVLDATDNFASKFFIAEACHFALKPYSHAGILRFCGQAMTVVPGRTCCYRCIFRDEPPDPDPPVGPVGAVAGVLGAIQAAEAIKYLVGCGELLTDRLLTCDVLTMRFRSIPVKRSASCPLCGEEATR